MLVLLSLFQHGVIRLGQFAVAGIVFICPGCHSTPAPPIVPKTSRITAHVYPGAQLGNREIDFVEVPAEHIPRVLQLVTPVTYIESGITPKHNPRVADVVLHHDDGAVTNVIVRYTGHNPAAVSVDDIHYYYASTGGRPHGTHELSELLTKIHREEGRENGRPDNLINAGGTD